MAEVPIAVLISGRGSNLRRLLEEQEHSFYRVAVVIADRAAAGLESARQWDIPVHEVRWTDYSNRADFTTAVCDVVDEYRCRFVILAGFMRILSPEAIQRFPNRIINVHPSLLPRFPGARAVADALAAGVEETGVTVHVVVEDVDAGPVIAQRRVPIVAGDDEARLHARIQEQEHELFPKVVDQICRVGVAAALEQGVR